MNKKFKKIIKKTGGRNHQGKITIRHRGKGAKRFLRPIDYSILKGTIESIEYDPNRTSVLAKCRTLDHKHIYYQIIGESYSIGQQLKLIPIGNIAIGETVYNISLKPGNKGKLSKASGTCCLILKQNLDGTTVIRLPSKQIKTINNKNLCMIGIVKNTNAQFTIIGKAGRNRWKGIRPTVNGRAMNAFDHPNGGKTAGGCQAKTLWGKLAKWVPTR